jgi:hypothetical protein
MDYLGMEGKRKDAYFAATLSISIASPAKVVAGYCCCCIWVQ